MSNPVKEKSLVEIVNEIAEKHGLMNDSNVMTALYDAATAGLKRGSAIWKGELNGN